MQSVFFLKPCVHFVRFRIGFGACACASTGAGAGAGASAAAGATAQGAASREGAAHTGAASCCTRYSAKRLAEDSGVAQSKIAAGETSIFVS